MCKYFSSSFSFTFNFCGSLCALFLISLCCHWRKNIHWFNTTIFYIRESAHLHGLYMRCWAVCTGCGNCMRSGCTSINSTQTLVIWQGVGLRVETGDNWWGGRERGRLVNSHPRSGGRSTQLVTHAKQQMRPNLAPRSIWWTQLPALLATAIMHTA